MDAAAELRAAAELATGPAAQAATELQPVFVGGTGRSGTTVTARLIGAHPAYHAFPVELKFLSARGGLCDLIDGRVAFRRFRRSVLERWFDRGPSKGLHLVLDRRAVEAALRDLERSIESDAIAAGRVFVRRLLDPLVAPGRRGWIEMTPSTIREAPTLDRLFPGARFVHCLRDGRDVACSVVPFAWGPTDPDEGLEWWAKKLERSFAATDALPPGATLTIQMERLVASDRAAEYDRLLAFLGLDDHPAMRRYFDEQVREDRAHIGRWRADVPREEWASFEEHHARLAAGFASAGRPYTPAP